MCLRAYIDLAGPANPTGKRGAVKPGKATLAKIVILGGFVVASKPAWVRFGQLGYKVGAAGGLKEWGL